MKTETFLNHNVSDITGVRQVDGIKFGVELELEGRNVGLQDVAVRGWQRHADGSLRGESVEYTSANARDLADLKKDVENLFSKFKQHNVKFNDSIRTSTHVHLNFSDKPFKKVVNFFALFTMLEEVLQYYSGEDRKGNLFCISSREAEGIIDVLVGVIAAGNPHPFAGDRYKYAACNLSTLYKFGTVEVRTMRGATSAEQVNTWVEILNDMQAYALKMEAPADLIGRLSLLGAPGLMQEIFTPKNYAELRGTFPAVQDLGQSLLDGARLLQVFAYQFHDAFTKEVQVQAKKMGRLRRTFLDGSQPSVYRPDGNRWMCVGANRVGMFWQDGEVVHDDPRLEWDENLGRFIVRYPNGDFEACRWRNHPDHGDEGFHGNARAMPFRRVEPEEFEDDDEFEEEPIFDEENEGDDF